MFLKLRVLIGSQKDSGMQLFVVNNTADFNVLQMLAE